MTFTPAAGRIPSHLIVDVIKDYISKQDDVSDGQGEQQFNQPLTVLAHAAGLHRDTLYRYMRGERNTIDFGVADRLMTAMHKNHLWHVEPLDEVYESVVLDEPTPIVVARGKKCAGCSNRFTPTSGNNMFCSDECKNSFMGVLNMKKAIGADTCINGHPREPGSSKVRANGFIKCLVCERIRDAKRREDRRNAA